MLSDPALLPVDCGPLRRMFCSVIARGSRPAPPGANHSNIFLPILDIAAENDLSGCRNVLLASIAERIGSGSICGWVRLREPPTRAEPTFNAGRAAGEHYTNIDGLIGSAFDDDALEMTVGSAHAADCRRLHQC